MSSQVIHAFYRGECVYVVPAVCAKQDLDDGSMLARWQGIYPGMIPQAHNLTIHESNNSANCNVSWMIFEPPEFEPATRQNLGRNDRLNLLFEILNTLGIHLLALRPEHVLVRKHLGDDPFTHTPRPKNAPPDAVPYNKNIVLLAGWHRTSQRMNEYQLAETREKFRVSLPVISPPTLRPSTKQLDGFLFCKEYHQRLGRICNTMFYHAESLREHLVEVHEVPREKLSGEVLERTNDKKVEGERGMDRLVGESVDGTESSEDIIRRDVVASPAVGKQVVSSNDGIEEAVGQGSPRVHWVDEKAVAEKCGREERRNEHEVGTGPT